VRLVGSSASLDRRVVITLMMCIYQNKKSS
jgi:hypothetical protein